MAGAAFHRFERDGKRFAIDPETCFCFECDEISWDVLTYYPETSVTRIEHALADKHPIKEIGEVIGELEWLRATKSILPPPKAETLRDQFQIERGLRHLAVELARPGAGQVARRGWLRRGGAPEASHAALPAHASAAAALLFSRSGNQTELTLEWLLGGQCAQVGEIAALCTGALRHAKLAGKRLTVSVVVRPGTLPGLGAAFAGHDLAYAIDIKDVAHVEAALEPMARQAPDTLARLAKAFSSLAAGAQGRVILRPGAPQFAKAVEELDHAGIKHIELDLPGAQAAQANLGPSALIDELRTAARYYAGRLKAGHYFRLDPIAPLFRRIYEGTPEPRTDPAGTHALAVDVDGHIYPAMAFFGQPEFRVGSLASGEFDEQACRRFDDVGSVTTAACRRCWARNLCGGGYAAVHQAMSGSFRVPAEAWCDAQRQWLTEAVAAFNLLSSEGVNFTRVYASLTPSAKPSLFQAVRAAMKTTLAVRPLTESDAEQLVKWENWNDAAYFVSSEKNMLMATQYDREMDTLHPATMDQEMMVIRRNGTPLGLIKLRPDLAVGALFGAIYLADDTAYRAAEVHKSFRFILDQAAGQQAFGSLLVPAAPWETGLRVLLEATGFVPAGTLREALYLHAQYHDVALYRLRFATSA